MFGGDVADGGFFKGQASPGRECVCIHQLDVKKNDELAAASRRIIKGIYECDFKAAQRLVANGHAKQDDFTLFVGYCGWGVGQLQGEVDRSSWYPAAADSSVVLGEMLGQARNVDNWPRHVYAPEGEAERGSLGLAAGGDGIAAWERLMAAIGREPSTIASPRGEEGATFADDMLREWVRVRLLDDQTARDSGVPPGTILRTLAGTAGARARARANPRGVFTSPFSPFVLDKPFLHKARVSLRRARVCRSVALTPVLRAGLLAGVARASGARRRRTAESAEPLGHPVLH